MLAVNINSCHKLCRQTAEGIRTAEVKMLYNAAMLITSQAELALVFLQYASAQTHAFLQRSQLHYNASFLQMMEHIHNSESS